VHAKDKMAPGSAWPCLTCGETYAEMAALRKHLRTHGIRVGVKRAAAGGGGAMAKLSGRHRVAAGTLEKSLATPLATPVTQTN